jgi:hypothetical protein
MTRITGLRTVDVRSPTSASLDGSDAMNPDHDYSAAYVVLETDGPHEGHGLTFTIGRGNKICVAAINALSMIDYLCIAGTHEGRVIEYVDHLHEHFLHPASSAMPPTCQRKLPVFQSR